VLCADKTGTITEGSLALAGVHALDDADRTVIDAVLCALAQLDPDPNATTTALGAHFTEPSTWLVTGRVPFSSGRKWGGMTFSTHDGTPCGSWVLGAPENVLTTEYSGALREQVEARAALGERVLVLAATDATFATGDQSLPKVRPVALVLLEDVMRADAPVTLQYFADQGVIVKVISGDNNVTVGAVAQRAGLRGWEDNVNATTLPQEDSEEFADAVENGTVFGRVTPHQKRAMVKALQARGHTVAMTGDGVNDVLALKDSDCGIAMASGSEATRGVAQLVLMDSNFAAMPAVVSEGRRVINNIERVASLFLAKTTYSVILSILTGVFALAYPLRPIHLSILSWFTIGVPAFFLALEPNDQRVETGFMRRVLGRAVPAGLVIAAATMTVFAIAQLDSSIDPDHARTIAVLVAGSVALMNLYRVARPLNHLRRALVIAMTVLFGLAFVLPPGRDLFELPTTAGWAYGVAAVLVAMAWPLLQLGGRIAERDKVHA
jgi:cation-transporting ATPase E